MSIEKVLSMDLAVPVLAEVFSQLFPDTTVSGTYSALSPKMAVAYAVTDKSNVCVSFTRGFRAGGVVAKRVVLVE